MLRLSAFLLLFCALLPTARAQSVRWIPSSGSLALGQESEIQLVFEDCRPVANLSLPRVNGLTLSGTGSQQNEQHVNGTVSVNVTYSFAVRATAPNRITIPAFTVETDKGRLSVPPASFDVVAAPSAQSTVTLDSVVNARFKTPDEVWSGEVFPLTYSLDVRRSLYQGEGNLEWSPVPLNVEEWSKPDTFPSLVNGENRLQILYRTRASLRAPGTVTLNQSSQRVGIAKGSDFFGRITAETYRIPGNTPKIIVKPLPDGAPASFNGAVGQFKLDSKIVPVSATIGDPITWTLTLTGTGNWPDISGLPAREASTDFRVVQPQPKRTPQDNSLFDATLSEDVVLIPSRAGAYTLGPISWSYFDPAKGAYQTITTPKVVVTVSAIQPSPSPAFATASTSSSTPAKPTPARPPLAEPLAPAGIPRDPLPGSTRASAPLPLDPLIAWLCAPLAPLLLFWGCLALRRARASDPLNPQRAAHLRLQSTLTALRANPKPADSTRLLQNWQHDIAILCNLARAVPTAGDLQTPDSENTTPEPTSSDLASLWSDAERSLYRADTPLPADWIARAESALLARRVAPFSPLTLFRPRNLLPFAAALALLVLAPPPPLSAASPSTAGKSPLALYAGGEFSAAEKAWRSSLETNPTDWIARHNLALSLTQQDRWEEAAAHATVAFVQSPNDPSVRWHFQLALQKASFAPAGLTAFLKDTPMHAVAGHLSPARWQHAAILASSLAALALAILLFKSYGRRSRILTALAALLGTSAIALAATAAYSIHLYQTSSDARATLVWHSTILRSIPTEADTAQKTSPLPAGTIAIAGKTFLGWTRLDFPNGQTGWVRKDDLLPLWQ